MWRVSPQHEGDLRNTPGKHTISPGRLMAVLVVASRSLPLDRLTRSGQQSCGSQLREEESWNCCFLVRLQICRLCLESGHGSVHATVFCQIVAVPVAKFHH